MKQVVNEDAVYHLAYWIQRYEDSNPEVGFGQFIGTSIQQAAQKLGLSETDYDFDHVRSRFK